MRLLGTRDYRLGAYQTANGSDRVRRGGTAAHDRKGGFSTCDLPLALTNPQVSVGPIRVW